MMLSLRPILETQIIKALRSASCAHFIKLVLVVSLDLLEFSLSVEFYRGLKDNVKDVLAAVGKANILHAIEKKAIKIDNHLYARHAKKGNAFLLFRSIPKPGFQVFCLIHHALPTTFSTTDVVSTEVDVAHCKPLSNEEK